VIIFVIVLTILFQFLNNIFKDNNDGRQKIERVLNEEKDYDVYFIGSSHTLYTFDPQYIDSLSGLNTYNLGTGWQFFDTSLLIVEELIKKKQPQAIFIDVFTNTFIDSPNTNEEAVSNQLKITDHLPFSINKIKYINNLSNNNLIKTFEYLNPFIRRRNIIINKPFDNYKEDLSDQKGFAKITGINQNDKQIYNYKDFDFVNNKKNLYDEKGLKLTVSRFEEISRILKICDKKQIELLFISTPDLRVFDENHHIKYHEFFKKLSQKLNIKYIDLNENFQEIGLEFSDFYDTNHVNETGAKKTSEYLSKNIPKILR